MIESREVVLPSGRFQLLSAGRPGAPLAICLHGFPDTAESFAELLRVLSDAGYWAVAPWLRGYSPSTLSGPHSINQLSGDLLDLLDSLAPGKRSVVIGHDWGALVAWLTVARAPARFAAVVVMALPHPRAFLSNLWRRPRQLERSWYVALFQLPWLAQVLLRRNGFALVDHFWRTWSPSLKLDPARMGRLKDAIAASMPGPIAYYRLGATDIVSLLRETGRIVVRTLHLHGAEDGCIDAAMCRSEERWMKAAFRLEIHDGLGHFLHRESPRTIGRSIVAWLNDGGVEAERNDAPSREKVPPRSGAQRSSQ